MTKRKTKKTYESDKQKAYSFLMETILKYQKPEDIAADAWGSASSAIVADVFRQSSFSYKEYCEELDKMKEYYKYLWD